MTLKTLGQLLVSGSSSCSRNRCLSCSLAPQSFAKGNCSFCIIIYFPNGFFLKFYFILQPFLQDSSPVN